MEGWFHDDQRALDAPGEVVPGLFAQTLERAGKGVAYSGVIGYEQSEAAVAADEAGEIPRVCARNGRHVRRAPARAVPPLRRGGGALPWRRGGPAQALDRIVAQRAPDELIYVVRAPPAGGVRLLPTGILGPGFRGDVLYSPTTRRAGLSRPPTWRRRCSTTSRSRSPARWRVR